MDNLQIGATVSFEVYPTFVIGSVFKNVRILAKLDADTTKYLNYDAAATHQRVFSSLPEGSTPDNYRSYSYLKVEHPDKTTSVVGIPYIKANTIQVIELQDVVISFENKSQKEINNILEVLAHNGYKPSEVSYQ